MIPLIRIRASDFIGGPLEDSTWNKIKDAKKQSPNEWKILFWVNKSTDIMTIADTVSKHTEALQIQTVIKVWEKCKNDYVFLDVLNEEYVGSSESRFQVKAVSPFNVMMAMDFISNHFKMLKEIGSYGEPTKKQKRNDSRDYDYNKK